jgi:hypothetical protein
MKKTIPFLIISLLTVTFGFSQTYQPWHEATGGPNFNTISAPYVKCTYSTSLDWTGDAEPPLCTTPGINLNNGRVSHKLVTVDGVDPCRCAGLGQNNSAPYFHENILPPDWSMDNNLPSQDTVVMLGCNDCSSGCAVCTEHAQIEYWFYPTVENSTLLVMFTFAEEDVLYHSAYGTGATLNPQFWIEVLDGETGQLIPSDYYKRADGTSNPNWPYNRFMACPSGQQSSQDSYTAPDEFGVTTYYWAHPKATPTTFPFRRCPQSQTQDHCTADNVGWFEYKPIAFNLSSYAEQGRSVKLRIRTYACSAEYHWAYCMFTAKMIPSEIKVDACNGQDIHFQVPVGFMPNSYIWYRGNDAASATPWIELYENTPGITSTGYDIYLNLDVMQQNNVRLYPYYRCEMKSYTGVPFIYEAHVKSYFIEPNFTIEQNFNGGGLSCTLRDSSTVYSVTPPTQPGGEPDTVYQETQHTRWYVKRFDQFEPIAEGTNEVNYTFDSTTISSDGQATFKLVVQDETSQCADSVEKTIQLEISGEGVTDIASRSLIVTPNPTDGLLHVELTGGASIATVTLYDLQGRTIVRENNHSPQQTGKTTTLHLRDLPAGTYLLRVTDTNGKEYQQKVIKK